MIGKIELLGATYEVVYKERVDEKDPEDYFTAGQYWSSIRKICISTKNPDGTDREKESMEEALFHEIVHCILAEGSYHNSNDDEPLVEWIAKNLYHLVKTKQLKL